MNSNKRFIKEHERTISAALKNSRLTGNKLKLRTDYFRRCLKSDEDKELFDKIETKIEEIMGATGKNQFTESDIHAIMCQALGEDIRDYDKSHLVNLQSNEITSVKAIPFKEMKSYTCGDTTITPLGYVTHKDWRGLEDFNGITYYNIEKTDAQGRTHAYRVFSHIDISRLGSDIDYREAVILELLDENNMMKTNCGGYVGNIQTVAEGKGSKDTVPVNSKYSLVFDATDATVIAKLREKVEESIKSKREGEER